MHDYLPSIFTYAVLPSVEAVVMVSMMPGWCVRTEHSVFALIASNYI